MNKFYVCNGSVILNNELWTLSVDLDLLLRIDMRSWTLIEAYSLDEPIKRQYQHIALTVLGEYIYIAPAYGKYLWRFHIPSETMEKMDGLDYLGIYVDTNKFQIVTEYGSKVYMLGNQLPGLYIYDLKSKQISVYEDYIATLRGKLATNRTDFFLNGYLKDQSFLYVPVYKSGMIIRFDLENISYEIFNIMPEISLTLHSISKCKEGFLLTTQNDERIIWNPNGLADYRKLGQLSPKSMYKSYYYAVELYSGKYYIPNHELCIIRENEKGIEKVYRFNLEGSTYSEYCQTTLFELVFEYEGDLYIQSRYLGSVYQIDGKSGDVKEIEIKVESELKSKINKNYMRRKQEKFFEENKDIGIKDFINYIRISTAH